MDFGSNSRTFPAPQKELGHVLRERGLHGVRSFDETALAAFRQICSLYLLNQVDDERGGLVRLRTLLAPGGAFLRNVPAFLRLYSLMDCRVVRFRQCSLQNRSHRWRKRALYRSLHAPWTRSDCGTRSSVGAMRLRSRCIGREAQAFYGDWLFPLSIRWHCVVTRWFRRNPLAIAKVDG
jgi:hypothetical protein